MLPLLIAAALAQAPTSADAAYTAGVAALKDKDAATATAQLRTCVELIPSRVDCHWELGWAYWLQNDWDKVVVHWETVERLDPAHQAVKEHLPTARGNLDVQKRVAASAAGAPDTVKAPAPEGATLRLRAVGDVMLGTDFPKGHMPPNDGKDMLTQVSSLMADADLTFANMEGPLCDGGKTTKCASGGNCYAFRTPTRYGQYVADAGVDLASTANNHATDFGELCRTQTEKTLTDLGIAFSGRPGTVASVESNGLKVAMIGFHTSNSGHNLNDVSTAVKLVQGLDATHDVVIVSFHGGAEGSKALHVPNGPEVFYGEQRGSLRVFSHAVVDAGADLVLGHGPHVPRAMEVYNDRLIAYSLGNFATYGRFNLSGYLGVGLILDVTLDNQGRFVTGVILPTKQIDDGVPVPDPENKAIDLIRKLSDEDFPQTGVVVGKDGSLGSR